MSDALAKADADNLYRFLQRRGVIAGDPGALPTARCAGTPFSGVDLVRAPAGGVICFTRALGDLVKAGDVVAEIVDPAGADSAPLRHPVPSRTDGLLFARSRDRLAQPGLTIAKVAGNTPLPHRMGALLED